MSSSEYECPHRDGPYHMWECDGPFNTHAEPNAKNDALRRNGGDLAGCVMYVSCEPCDGCVRMIRNETKIAAIRWPEGVIALP